MIRIEVSSDELVEVMWGTSLGSPAYSTTMSKRGVMGQHKDWDDRGRELKEMHAEVERLRSAKRSICFVCETEDKLGEKRFTQSHPIQCVDNWLRKENDWHNLLRRVEKLSPKWRPIDTAPKDETAILVHHYRGDVVVAQWGPSCEKWCVIGGDAFVEPSHWMPLSEAPKP